MSNPWFNVDLRLEMRGKLHYVLDNANIICGVYRSEQAAKKSLSNIRRKIIRELKYKSKNNQVISEVYLKGKK